MVAEEVETRRIVKDLANEFPRQGIGHQTRLGWSALDQQLNKLKQPRSNL
jgi:hypothetical protein